MPVEMIGMVAATPEGDSFGLASWAAAHTQRLRFLVAHRPGFVAPTLAARMAATFDNTSAGRLSLHIITGGWDIEQRMDGDVLDKAARYRRSDEYIGVLRRVWTDAEPFDHEGEFYSFERAFSQVRCVQTPHVPVFFGGASEDAVRVGARHCDCYALWGEPLAGVRQRIEAIRKQAEPHGRTPEFSVSFRPIIAPTESAAWERAHAILAAIQSRSPGAQAQQRADFRPEGSNRLLDAASQADLHDRCLWMGIAAATGAQSNSSCLVGTPDQVVEALMDYYELGVRKFLIRGFDPLEDAALYGQEVVPRLREAVARRDAA